MRSGAISFLAGVMLLQQFAFLPSLYWCLLLIPIFALALWRKQQILWLVFFFILGFAWTLLHAQQRLQQQLLPALISKDVVIAGRISGLPQKQQRYTRFEFKVKSLKYQGNVQPSPGHIQLSWYGKHQPVLKPGDYWQLQVRLKPPHGVLNPGGFDYEKHLFQKGIRAKGYVRKSEHNQPVVSMNNHFNLDRLRQNILYKLNDYLNQQDNSPLIYALAIGERKDMSSEHWRVLRDTGTAHLVAISGLHIGIVASLAFWLGRWGWSFCGRGPLLVPAHKVAAIFAIAVAFSYALLAGWSIPTQRAFIMVMIVMAGLLVYRHQVTSRVLAFALLAVLIYDPLSVLAAGFWLSFAAVSVIAYAVSGIKPSTAKLKQWGHVQWAVSLGLLPLMLLLFQQVSIISPLANIWAIPLISLFVVPLVLLAIVFLLVYGPVSDWLLQIAISILDAIWWILELMLQWPWAVWHTASPTWWAALLAMLGILLLLTPRGWPARNLALILLLPLFFASAERPVQGEAKITLLDVGQGLAAVIQTKNHVLVFDSGPRFSERYDSGSMVVLPFLLQQGITKIDTLLVSHEDNDHIGGAGAILKQIEVEKILTSAPGSFAAQDRVTTCLSGQSWHWDEVEFTILHPEQAFLARNNKRRQRNNRSCVLRISSGDKSVLLAADIEKQAERVISQKYGEKLNSDVLVVPHHGSQSSSSALFLDTVKPAWALFPAGFLNRYRLPSKKVMRRYQSRGIRLRSTAQHGAISFKLLIKQPISISSYRQKAIRYWHYPRE
jgi:competence protein ComEC